MSAGFFRYGFQWASTACRLTEGWPKGPAGTGKGWGRPRWLRDGEASSEAGFPGERRSRDCFALGGTPALAIHLARRAR